MSALAFRALTPAQAVALDEQRDAYTTLAESLAAISDAEAVVIAPGHDPNLAAVAAHGTQQTGTVRYVTGAPSRCHTNVAWLARLNEHLTVMTGWVLNRGLWRQHTWASLPGGTLIETTVAREAYYGVALTGLHRDLFVSAHTHDTYLPDFTTETFMPDTTLITHHREDDGPVEIPDLSNVRCTLDDALVDLMHVHGGDRRAVLGELAVALEAAHQYYDAERGRPVTVLNAEDSLHDSRRARATHGRVLWLPEDAYRLLCGLTAPTATVDSDHITGDFDQVRDHVPAEDYLPAEDAGHLITLSVTAKHERTAREEAAYELGELADITRYRITGAEETAPRTWEVTALICTEEDFDAETVDALTCVPAAEMDTEVSP